MSLLRGTRRALMDIKKIAYLLRATFDAADQGYADGQVLDSFAEGVRDGTLTVVEVDGTLAIVSNKCVFTAQATPAWGDQGFYSQAITRALGRGLLGTYNISTKAPTFVALASDESVHYNKISSTGLYFTATQIKYLNVTGASVELAAAYSALANYKFTVVIGGYDVSGIPWRAGQNKANYLYGVALYVQGGTFADWTLLWRTVLDNTATLYAVFSNKAGAGTINNFRVPDVDLSAVLQPAALSTFTAPNGTSLDAIAPEVGGAWTEQSGNWEIQGNKATITADVLANATIETSDSDVVLDVVVNLDATSGFCGPIIRHTNENNYWTVAANETDNAIEIWEVNGGVATKRSSTAVAIADSTDYDVRAIAYGQTIDGFLDGGNKVTYGLAALNETESIHGLRIRNQDSTTDNFVVYPRTGSVYDRVLGGV